MANWFYLVGSLCFVAGIGLQHVDVDEGDPMKTMIAALVVLILGGCCLAQPPQDQGLYWQPLLRRIT